MGFVFKKDQPSSEFAPGVTRRIVNSDATESKMLYVSEITIAPGKAAPLVTHPDDEEGVLVVEGKLTLVLGDKYTDFNVGDCIYIKPGPAHAFINESDQPARLLCIFPNPTPRTEVGEYADTSKLKKMEECGILYRRGDSFEFLPNVERRELIDPEYGAKDLTISDLEVLPDGEIPPHYHPEHEEVMMCLDGELEFVYSDGPKTTIKAGDILMGEPQIIHGFKNVSGKPARMLAIHPTLKPERIFI